VTACRLCGCTDDDCRQCIERTGEPCSWIAPDLCSACGPDALRAELQELGEEGADPSALPITVTVLELHPRVSTVKEDDEPNALHPELAALVERGLLSRAEALEIRALEREINTAVERGEMTIEQADALGQMLGVQYAANTNARRARRTLQ